MRPERLYLQDILEAADQIAELILGARIESFVENNQLRRAVLQLLTTIGEAASRVSPDLRRRHAGVRWSRISSFRNIAVHEYFAVEWKTVWYTASKNAPELRRAVDEIIRIEFDSESPPAEGLDVDQR